MQGPFWVIVLIQTMLRPLRQSKNAKGRDMLTTFVFGFYICSLSCVRFSFRFVFCVVDLCVCVFGYSYV